MQKLKIIKGGKTNTTMGGITEAIANGYELEARYARGEADEIASQISELKAENKRLKARGLRLKKYTTFHMVLFALCGFLFGVAIAVAQLLLIHGPTVTIPGTICAYGIYTAGGVFVGSFLAGIGKAQFADERKYCAKTYRENTERIRILKIEYKEKTEEERKYKEKALKERENAWYYNILGTSKAQIQGYR